MKQPLKLRMYKVMIFPICFVLAKKLGGIPQQKTDPAWEELVAVPVKNAKSIVEMYREANRTLSLDQLSEEGKWIFSNKSSEKTIRDLPRL
jgi:hypothetical protein